MAKAMGHGTAKKWFTMKAMKATKATKVTKAMKATISYKPGLTGSAVDL